MTDAELIAAYIEQRATDAGLNPAATRTALTAESGLDPAAVGDGGAAVGVGQLHPQAAADMGLSAADRADPLKNIDASVGYLARMRDVFGDETAAHGAYMLGAKGFRDALTAGALPENVTARLRAVAPYLAPAPAAPPATSVPPPAAPAGEPHGGGVPGLAGAAQDAYGFLRDVAIPGAAGAAEHAIRPLAAAALAPTGLTEMPSMASLASSALNTAAVIYPASSRLAQATLQGGAALASVISEHHSPGESLVDTASKLNGTDFAMIGSAVLLGALLPGAKSPTGEAEAAIGVSRAGLPAATRAGQTEVVRAQNTELATATLHRFTDAPWSAVAENPTAVLSAYPVTQSERVQRAFAAIPRDTTVDATDYVKTLAAHQADGKPVPSAMQQGLRRVEPEMGVAWIGSTPVIQPTGRYRAPIGALLDANMNLGRMINGVGARGYQGALKPALGDLTALRGSLTDATRSAIAGVDPAAARSFDAALVTAKDAGQNRALVKWLGEKMDPATGVLDGEAARKALARRDVDFAKRFGAENFSAVKGWMESVRRLEADPVKANTWGQIMQWASGGGRAAIAAEAIGGALAGGGVGHALGMPGYALGFTAAGGAATGVFVLRRLIGSSGLRTALEKFAATPSGSAQYAIRAGRVAALVSAIHAEVADQLGGGGGAPPDAPPTSAPPPVPSPSTRIPAPQ